MPTTANEAAPATPSALPGPETGDAAPSARRTDAVGAEIAVTIHASRYSTNRGAASKNLPPVHEETRTVIIFPTGAVVRLSASVTTGELVVLTNQQTGDDVICRVANVKAQPGIQNYVNLEFTQRAPSFWGDAIQSSRANRPDPPKMAVQPAIMPQIVAPEKNRVQPEHVAAAEPAKREPIAVPSAELLSAVQAVTDLLNSVPGSTRGAGRPETLAAQLPTLFKEEASGEEASFEDEEEDAEVFPPTAAIPPAMTAATNVRTQPQAQLQVVPPAASKAPASASSSPTPILTSADLRINAASQAASNAAQAPPALNIKTEPLQPASVTGHSSDSAPKTRTSFGAGELSLSKPAQSAVQEWARPATFPAHSGEKAGPAKKILLIAAAAVVLVILGGVGGAVLFRQRPAAPAQPSALTSAPMPMQASDTTAAIVPTAATPTVMAQPASAPARAASANSEVFSQPVKAAPPADISTHRSNLQVGKLAAPVARSARVVSSEPPPELVAAGSVADSNLLTSAGRTNEPVAPVTPGAFRLGGQLRQPKLISAPPARYPPTALRARVQGVVVVDALVDTNGQVTSVKVISGSADLQQAAMEAVHNWKYEPAQLNGQPIAVHTKVNVTFRLE